jgi:hypothetical protein
MELHDEPSCMALHPVQNHNQKQNQLALGFQRGRILLFRNLYPLLAALWSTQGQLGMNQGVVDNLLKELPRALLHWHAHAVRALRFSTQGDFLFSAGDEAVLVLWPLARVTSSSSNMYTKYLPRLGGAIVHIAASHASTTSGGNANVLLATRDNALSLVHTAK